MNNQPLPLVTRDQYEWHAMWHRLAQDPANANLPQPTAAQHQGEVWQYMCTQPRHPYADPTEPLVHCFRHRFHPTTDDRRTLFIPVSPSYTHIHFTHPQPSPNLLVEWIYALQHNFVPQCTRYYLRNDACCATGLLLHMAGFLTPAGVIDDLRVNALLGQDSTVVPINRIINTLFDLPPYVPPQEFYFHLQRENDRGLSFPALADLILAQPRLAQRYAELTAA